VTQPEPSHQPTPVATPAEEPLPPIPKRTILTRLREYFLGEDPTLLTAMVPTCFLSMLLYTRSPATNFIFDEQEALLANPYVRAASDPGAKIGWLQAFKRDFWGLTPDRTIGSYRPLPDILWRALWKVGARDQSAFPHAHLNVMLHGFNGALVVLLVLKWTRDRLTAWLAGGVFVATAVVTEAVSGVVGLADVLGGAGALLALLALNLRLPLMPLAVFGATMMGLASKESALCIVPLVPFAALCTAQLVHPERPLRWARAGVAAVAAGAAFVLYVEARRRLFPVATPQALTVEANADKPWLHRAFATALRWYAQPMLPHDPLNNPLIDASPPYRVAGALRVYMRGLGQIVFPRTLSGDYSAPQEPIPNHLVFPESILGAAAIVLPLLAAPVLVVTAWWRARRRRFEWGPDEGPCRAMPDVVSPTPWTSVCPIDARPIVAFAMMWILVSYFPVSNIPVLLPTVRAERFWYFPAIGSAILLALAFARLLAAGRRRGAMAAAVGLVVLFLGFQSYAARRHALDYANDLAFWDATRKAVPRSAKAHLNYSVMLGARGDLEGRLVSNGVALELAPKWPMASVYEGDTLCRLHRAPEAVPHYLRGFELGPNDQGLIALGMQCLWDEHQLDEGSDVRDQLQDLADKYPGSWLKYFVDDTLANGDDYTPKGVNPKYRPRGYNEGPKKDE
jgi:hypothetical protein